MTTFVKVTALPNWYTELPGSTLEEKLPDSLAKPMGVKLSVVDGE